MQQQPTGLLTVFVLQHLHELPSGEEDVKFIGVYSTAESAEAARQRISLQPGFAEAPAGFSVDRYELDVDHWTEGYVTLLPEDM